MISFSPAHNPADKLTPNQSGAPRSAAMLSNLDEMAHHLVRFRDCIGLFLSIHPPGTLLVLAFKRHENGTPWGHTLKEYTALAVFIIPLLIFSAYRSRNFLSVIALLLALTLLVLIWLLANRATVAGLLAAIICISIAVGA